MKSILIAFIVCLVAYDANAQNGPKAKAFINEIIIAQGISDSISVSELLVHYNLAKDPRPKVKRVYEDSVSKGGIDMMRGTMRDNPKGVFYSMRDDSVIYIDSIGRRSRMLRKDSYKQHPLPMKVRFEPILADSMMLTSRERAYINTEIEKMGKHIWQQDLVMDAPLIAVDSVRRVFDRRNTDRLFDGWTYFHNKGVDKIYSFTVPIFFRNDTYCLFYYDFSCGWLCGEGQVAIYKKVKGKWIKWSILSSWVS